jgi:hypothetical protein
MNRALLFSVVTGLCSASVAGAADWPLWRFDARRTGASPQELAARLHMQWNTRR